MWQLCVDEPGFYCEEVNDRLDPKEMILQQVVSKRQPT